MTDLVKLSLLTGEPVYLNPDQVVSVTGLPTQAPTTNISTATNGTWTVLGAVDEIAGQLGAQMVLTVTKAEPPQKPKFDTFDNPADFEKKLKERRDTP